MPLPSVDIQLQSGGLGRIAASDDRVVGLVINGTSDVARQIFSVADTVGHPALANTDYGTEYARQIADFYTVAANGTELWVLSVDPALSTIDLFAPGGPIERLMITSGGRINVIGLSRKLKVEPTDKTDGIDTPTMLSIAFANAFAERMAADHMPVRVILDGKNLAAGSLSPVRNLRSMTANRVGMLLASNNGAVNSCMGLLLGRIASIPVNRNIGRVKDGAVPVAQGYLTNGQTVEAAGGNIIALHDKGYIVLRKYVGRVGYFWNDDHMATLDTDDYFSLANGRTIDKATRIAYSTYLNELLAEVPVDRNTGKIAPTVLKQYQGMIERAITLGMGNEISGVSAFVDPKQDILATSVLVVDLRIVPTGTNRTILVRLGFSNPQNA